MSVDASIPQFAEAATEVGAEVTRTDVTGADSVIADAIEPPAVGVPVPISGIEVESIEGLDVDPTPAELDEARTGVTGVPLGIAEYGSVVIEGDRVGSEPVSLFVDHHVAVLAASDLAADLEAAMARMDELAQEGADLVIATGPSATADMGELVLGAHGPETVDIILVEDR